MNVRIEVRESSGGWEQPVVVIHPDPEVARRYAVVIVDALRTALRKPARATIGDNENHERWAEGEVVYARG